MTQNIQSEIGKICCGKKHHEMKNRCEICGKPLEFNFSPELKIYIEEFLMKSKLALEQTEVFQDISNDLKSYLVIKILKNEMKELLRNLDKLQDNDLKIRARESFIRFLKTPEVNPFEVLVNEYAEIMHNSESTQEQNPNLNRILMEIQQRFSDFDSLHQFIQFRVGIEESNEENLADAIEIYALQQSFLEIKKQTEIIAL